MTANICTLFVLFELLTIVNYSLLIIIMCCTHEDWSYTQLVLSVREMVNNNNVYMRLFSILLYSSASSRAKVCVPLTELHSLLLYIFYKAGVRCVYCSTMSDRLNILVASATHRELRVQRQRCGAIMCEVAYTAYTSRQIMIKLLVYSMFT